MAGNVVWFQYNREGIPSSGSPWVLRKFVRTQIDGQTEMLGRQRPGLTPVAFLSPRFATWLLQ